MKEIVVNLKRFDIPKSYHGVSDCENPKDYMKCVIEPLVDSLKKYDDLHFTVYPPEAHIITACEYVEESQNIVIGTQSNHFEDVSEKGNFGAFTTLRTASSMKAIGCQSSLIGHFEERKNLNTLYSLVNVENQKVINEILNRKIIMAQNQGLSVCYCIGESETQMDKWQEVLLEQLEIGLKNVDRSKVIIGYEPLWSIGPGKIPADKPYIEKIIRLVKDFDPKLKVIYGGGVKQDNACMLASIENLDGGLIGLTNFKDNLGFHADEFLEIIDLYHGNLKEDKNEA